MGIVKNGCADLINKHNAFQQEISALEEELSSLEAQKERGEPISLEGFSQHLDAALSVLPTAPTLCTIFQEDEEEEKEEEKVSPTPEDPEGLDEIIVDDDEVGWTDSMYFFIGDVMSGVASVWDSIFCSLGGECKPGSLPLPKTRNIKPFDSFLTSQKRLISRSIFFYHSFGKGAGRFERGHQKS